MSPSQQRPVGVMLLAAMFVWIGGFGTLVFPLFMLLGNFGFIWRGLFGAVIHSDTGIAILGDVLTGLWFLAYVAYLVIGIGLWKLKNRARKGVLVISALGIAGGLIAGIVAGRQSLLMGLSISVWCISLCGWQAWYLMRPRVRYAFGDWRKYSPTGEWIEPPALTKRGKIGIGIAWPVTTIGLFMTLLFFAIESTMRNSEAYRMAMNSAQASPCVVKALGTPLKAGFITGNVEESGQNGSADYDFAIRGPKDRGFLSVDAKKSQGKWTLNSLVFSHHAHDMRIVPALSDTPCQ
jgi:hypothetical protein